MRYARQMTIPLVGRRGQDKIRALEVWVAGDSVASSVASLYLAGAGVGRLHVLPALFSRCVALNREVEVLNDAEGDCFGVRVKRGAEFEAYEPPPIPKPTGLELGALGARWAMMQALGPVSRRDS